MKKLLYSAFLATMLIACTGGSYNVTVKCDKSIDNTVAYMINYDSGDTIDSATVANGMFTLAGKVEKPIMARILYKGGRQRFVLEKGNILVVVDSGYVEGTPLNDLMQANNNAAEALQKEYAAIHNDSTICDSIKQIKYEDVDARYNKMMNEFFENNKENPLGLAAFIEMAFDFNSERLDSILATCPDGFRDYKRVQKMITFAQNKAATAVGKKFADFAITAEDGVVTKLSDYAGKGNYLLVDFWASWCGPCRREIPVIKEIYEKYKSQGLSVLGVAVWDKPDDTMRAINDLLIPWPQIINAQNVPTDLYGINGIPHIMLIGPDGTILSRGLQGNELKAKVDEIMSAAK